MEIEARVLEVRTQKSVSDEGGKELAREPSGLAGRGIDGMELGGANNGSRRPLAAGRWEASGEDHGGARL